jgi:transposase
MSTIELYDFFGIRGYEYIRTEYQYGQVMFIIEQKRRTLRCAACGSRDVQPRGRAERQFRSLPIENHATFLVLPIPRVACRTCGVIRQVEIGFADPRRTYTKAFERYALELSRYITIFDVARHLDVSWDIIKDIQKRDLSHRYAKPKVKDLSQVAIDEIAIANGHHYVTVVLDLESGAVVFVGEGKGGGRSEAVLEAIARVQSEDQGSGDGHVSSLPGDRLDTSLWSDNRL